MSRNINEILEDLDGGTLSEKLGKGLAAVALMAIENERSGEINLTLKVKPLRGSQQVQITHKIKTDQPTRNGSRTETDENITLMYVGPRGVMTITPPDQADMFKRQKEHGND